MSENKFDYKNYIDNIIAQNKEYIDIDFVIDYMDVFEYDLSKRIQLLKRIYSYNLKLTKELDTEVSNLSEIDPSSNQEIADIKLIESPRMNSSKKQFDKSIKEDMDISPYIKMIDSYNENANYEYLIQMIDKQNILVVINQLIKHYTLEYITLKRLKKEDKNSTIILEEENRIKNILNNLYNCRNSQMQTNFNTQNNLIYLTKSTGNINFLDSLNDISNEYYPSILNAFLSIYNGTFKDSKQLSKIGSGFTSPLLRVRADAIRIYYLKITSELYLITDVKVKKIVNSNRYSEYLQRISKEANNEKNLFLNLDIAHQEEIIEKHKLITREIIAKLDSKKKVLR